MIVVGGNGWWAVKLRLRQRQKETLNEGVSRCVCVCVRLLCHCVCVAIETYYARKNWILVAYTLFVSKCGCVGCVCVSVFWPYTRTLYCCLRVCVCVCACVKFNNNDPLKPTDLHRLQRTCSIHPYLSSSRCCLPFLRSFYFLHRHREKSVAQIYF